ncbi:MAG: rRNA adenine N-6-methyltransferase family protein [Mariprofundaceae bacterium]|nr:rRNA adenine N-6-methyltransferase family protein [Mariprofundaceae bacterium]
MTEMMNTHATLEVARRNMVEYQIRCCKVLDPELLDMLDRMPREDYTPPNVRSLAYMEGRVPISCDQEMLSPLQEASIMQQLSLQGHEKILEIGAGTGYLTTLLSMYAAEVTSCELYAELSELSRKNLSEHAVENATVVHINAMDSEAMKNHGDIASAYDVIVVGASLNSIPDHFYELMADDAQIISFLGKNPVVTLTHQQKINGTLVHTGMFETLLQDMEAIPEKRKFIF